jgi:hypothetical protein
MPCPPHSPWFDLHNNTWQWVHIMKLPIMQFSPSLHYFIPLRSKYSPQHPVLKHPHSVCALPLMLETKFHTHTKWLAELCFVYFNLYVPRQQAGGQKTQNRTVASVPRI